ncbi:FtsH protease activity modulator HflK [Massilia phyllosphaerae]|uniref:FtsH protease activity modulator HflK n=1 Tax=Massilia phyllosphaerae TaxID=3106034 RepID=UPI002B1CB9E6|nr:FtsH protease activity modulator HflK [Massilia sp. SGZ-792]
MPVSFIKRLGVKLSLNDPRWGHDPNAGRKAQENKRPGNNDGPPDLDQLWRDFNQRLNRIFNKRNDGGGGGPYRPDARGVGITAGVVGGIAALIWLASGAFVVPDGQVGVVTTFGQLSHTVSPGVSWRWPAPIQAVETVNTSQVQTAEIGYRANIRNKQPAEALMLTGDQNIVDVQFSVQYKIKQPIAWLFNNRDQVETVRDAAETVVRELVGQNKMDTLLSPNRDQVALEARNRIQQLAERYRLGAEIVGVTVQQIAPPDAVAAAFEDAARAQEDRNRARGEAQAYADDILPQAKARADRLRQDAEGYRAETESKATGIAARFDKVVAEYAKAPGVTRDRMYFDTMQQVFSSTSKVMIDAKTGTNQVVLPLDQMLSRSVANDAAIGSRSGPVMAPPQQNGQQGGQQNPAQAPAQQQAPAQAQAGQADAAAPASAAATAPAATAEQGDPHRRDLRSREHSRERESR